MFFVVQAINGCASCVTVPVEGGICPATQKQKQKLVTRLFQVIVL